MELRLGTSDQPQTDAFHEKWKAAYHDSGFVIIDTLDLEEPDLTLRYAKKNDMDLSQMRERITFALGQITKRILDDGFYATLMVTGGAGIRS